MEKLHDFLPCGDLLKLLKGHEEGTGKGLVLVHKIKLKVKFTVNLM